MKHILYILAIGLAFGSCAPNPDIFNQKVRDAYENEYGFQMRKTKGSLSPQFYIDRKIRLKLSSEIRMTAEQREEMMKKMRETGKAQINFSKDINYITIPEGTKVIAVKDDKLNQLGIIFDGRFRTRILYFGVKDIDLDYEKEYALMIDEDYFPEDNIAVTEVNIDGYPYQVLEGGQAKLHIVAQKVLEERVNEETVNGITVDEINND